MRQVCVVVANGGKSAYAVEMEWLNYHHLFYFWTVAQAGSISAAGRQLRLAQPTVSGQIKELESTLKAQLFHRRGNRLVLTDTGNHVYRYANEIFALGRELQESLAGRAVSRGRRLVMGIADVVPKIIAHRLLEPALRSDKELHVECYEDRHERLLADLALYELDVVLSDTPVGPRSNIRGHSHLLGESGVSLFAKPRLAERLRKDFPASLTDVPLLLPMEQTTLRQGLKTWFEARKLRPRVRAEFQDTALLMVLGRAGEGVFAAPTVIEQEIQEQHRVSVVARLDGLRERFYAITVERKISHAAVRAITEHARSELFAPAD
jgi:LysR family transcriptional activator of nhaA